jgi:tRNA dimethylallyltransferase
MKMKQDEKKLIVIFGPTGIGKTNLAIKAAKVLGTCIISADSRQVYTEMNIGTAKPTKESMDGIPHYLLGHISINQEYSAGSYERESLGLVHKLFKTHDTLILAGGTGLYIKALCEGLDTFPEVPSQIIDRLNDIFDEKGISPLQEMLKTSDPEYFAQVDINNQRRLIRALSVIEVSGKKYSSFLMNKSKERSFSVYYLFLKMERKQLYARINKRVDRMIEEGLVEEVRQLLKYKDLKALESVGYQEIFEYLDGKCTLDFAINKIKQHSRNYAKRQMTWMRKNNAAKWFDAGDVEEIMAYLKSIGITTDQGRFPEADQ